MAYELPAYNEENWHLKLNASLDFLHNSNTAVVRYAGGWPARPTTDASITVIWVGGTPETPPTDHLTGVDLWYVPNPQ